jgi:putative membrane protein
MNNGWFGMGGFMWLFWLVPIILIVFAVKFFSDQSGRSNMTETPLEILKKRYARGEINKEDFERLKKDLL